jgi:predicted ATP-grasp superfamily ATP-dependent carboligase
MNVLIIFQNKSLPLNIMRCLADAGVKCFVFGCGTAQEIKLSKYCRDYVKCEPAGIRQGSPELVDQINRYCAQKNIVCVIPGDYPTTVFLSKVSGLLNVKTTPVAQTETLEILSNKWTFARLLQTHDLPMPQTFLAEDLQQYEAIPLPFPRAVKPLEGGGRWIAGRDTPGSYIKKDREEYMACAKDGFPLLVQEFIPGTDVGLNIFAVQGKLIAWTMQEFVDGGNRLKFFKSEEMLKLGEQLAAATNFQGLANIDLRLDSRDGRYTFIECNPRFWGSLRASRWYGVNFPVLAVSTALGKDTGPKIQPQNIDYVFPSKVLRKLFKGQFSALKGLPQATRKDLCQIIGDPLSCLYSVFHRE